MWKRATKFVRPLQEGQVTRDTAVFADEVFDTMLVRRLKWDQYVDLNDEDYFITPEPEKSKDRITTSEVDHGDSACFEQLEERGYRPREVFDRFGWTSTGPVQVDKLIAVRFRMKAYAAERAERIQRQAQGAPGMIRGGRSGRGGGHGGQGRQGGHRGGQGQGGRGRGRGGGLVANQGA